MASPSLFWLHPSFVVLHAGHGQELATLEYVYRVLLSLIAFGGVAAIVFCWMSVIDTVRSLVATRRDSQPNDP